MIKSKCVECQRGRADRNIRSIASHSVSAIALTSALGFIPSPALAACTAAGTTITCTGDISGGFSTQGDFDILNMATLTDDIGGTGIRIVDTSTGNFAFDAVIDPVEITLTGGSLATRNGFNIVSESGSISGTINGDIRGQVGSDATNSATFPPRNFSALGFEAGTGISVTHTGTVDVTMPIVTRTTNGARADIATGRFAAIRAESETGDVTVINTGDVILDGGERNASNTRTSGTAGTLAIDFSNAVSDISGIMAQGRGDLSLQQTGNVNVSGAEATISAETVDGRADVQGEYATTSGIYVPAFSTTGGVNDPNLPRFETIDMDVMGDITVVGGDIVATATVNSNGGTAGEALLTTDNAFRNQEAIGIQIGSGNVYGNGQTVDLTLVGNVSVTGGSTTAMALASNGGAGETAGRIRMLVNGQDAIGIAITPDRGPNLDLPTEVDVSVEGDISVFGGDVVSTSTGSGSGEVTINTTTPSTDFEASQYHSARGGDALGLRFMRISDIDSFTMDGSITVGGGSASAQHTGDNESLSVQATGGGANGFYTTVGAVGASTTAALDIDVHLVGPDVSTVVSGAGVLGNISSGRQAGPYFSFVGADSQLTYSGDITNTPGSGTVTATDGAFVNRAFLGFVVGANPTVFDSNINGTLIYDGTIDLTGGDITVSGPLSPSPNVLANANNWAANSYLLVGQGVAGIFGEVYDFEDDSTSLLTIDHRGVIDITAGSGQAGLGVAEGIGISGDYYPELDGHVIVSGTVNITGADFGSTRGGTASAGVLLELSGDGSLDVDGGTITASGSGAAGVQANSYRSNVVVRNGGTVTANGTEAAGIAIGSFEDFSFVTSSEPEGYFASSTNMVTIGAGSSVTSAQFIGIHDESQSLYTFGDEDYAPDLYNQPTYNATTVDVAGTVTGGNGTAIDLGSGMDRLILRQSAVVNGSMLLGSGDDVFVFQDFTETKAVDGGDDRDAIEVTVAAGNSSVFDPSVETPNLINFETIAKEGDGTLTVPGGTFANGPLDFNVNDGTGIVDGDRPQMNIFVADGATFRTDSQVGNAVIDTGGRISGNGTYDNFTIKGIVAPGNSIGTITVTGDAAFNAGSVYEVEIEAPDQSDLIDVAGTATIDGGTLEIVRLSPDQSYADGQTYRIIEAGDVVVNSGFVFDEPFSLLATELVYGADYVDLILSTNIPLQDFAETRNQRAAASGLNDLEQTGDALAVFNELYMLDPDSAREAFDLASGEIHASVNHLVRLGTDLFTATLRNQGIAGLATGSSDKMAASPALGYFDDGQYGGSFDTVANRRVQAAWGGLVGSVSDIGGDGNAAEYDMAVGGVVGGYQGQGTLGEGTFVAGFGAGYLAGDSRIEARLSDADTASANFGAYGAWTDGVWTLSGVAAYAATHVSTERRILFGDIDRTADAGYWTHTFAIDAEAARAFDMGGFTLSPLVSLNAGHTGHGLAQESGAGALDLAIASDGSGWFDTGLGLELARTIITPEGTRFSARAKAVWEHAFAGVTPTQDISLAGSPTGFTVAGPDAGSDRLKLEFNLDIAMGENVDIFAGYGARISTSGHAHSANIGIKASF